MTSPRSNTKIAMTAASIAFLTAPSDKKDSAPQRTNAEPSKTPFKSSEPRSRRLKIRQRKESPAKMRADAPDRSCLSDGRKPIQSSGSTNSANDSSVAQKRSPLNQRKSARMEVWVPKYHTPSAPLNPTPRGHLPDTRDRTHVRIASIFGGNAVLLRANKGSFTKLHCPTKRKSSTGLGSW